MANNTGWMEVNEEMQAKYPRTITVELWTAWQNMRRVGDAEKIMKTIKKCRPVVDRALNYGHIKNMRIADKISKFFKDRLEEEKKTALNLMRLAEENS